MRSGRVATRVAVIGAVLGLTLLTGCGTPPAPDASPTATPGVTPSDVALPDAPPEALPFDCTDVVDAPDFHRLVGMDLPAVNESGGVFAELQSRHMGRGWCSWYRGEPYVNVSLSVQIAAPEDAPLGAGCVDTSGFSGWVDCSSTTVVNGYRISTFLGAAVELTVAEAESVARELFAPAVAALEASDPPSTWAVPAGAWPGIVDCSAIAAAADVSAAVGVPGMTVADVTGQGEDGSTPRDVTAGWGFTDCHWLAPDVETASVPRVTIEFVAGGGWLWRDLIPLAEPATIDRTQVDDADEAAFECVAADSCSLLLRFGINTVRISGTQEFTYEGVALTRAQLTSLASTLAPAIDALS